jgi:cephalosporin-C deacetylase-like acetyl esterase
MTEERIAVPGLMYVPTEPAYEPLLLYLHERGMHAADAEGTPGRLAAAGRTVLALDLRGWGETAPGKIAEQSYFGNEFTESFLAMHLNRPLLGQRVLDVLSVIERLAGLSDEIAGQGCELHGVGSGGLVALHAAALDERIRAVELHAALGSWTSVVESPISYEQLADVVPGVLAHYDLPELAASLAPRKLTIRNPVDPQAQPLADDTRRELFAPVEAAYKQADASAALKIDAK